MATYSVGELLTVRRINGAINPAQVLYTCPSNCYAFVQFRSLSKVFGSPTITFRRSDGTVYQTIANNTNEFSLTNQWMMGPGDYINLDVTDANIVDIVIREYAGA